MDKSHPLLEISKQSNKNQFNITYEKKNDSRSILKENEANLEENEAYNSKLPTKSKKSLIFLEILTVKKLSSLLNKSLKSDEDSYFINFKVRYKSNNKLYSWEIMKSHLQIKDLFIQINLEIVKNAIKIDDNELMIKFDLFRMIDITQYNYKNNILLSVLNDIINNPKLKSMIKILEFLELSLHSFENYDTNDFFIKPKEGYILKRSKLKKYLSCLQYFCCSNRECCSVWQRRWFVLKDDMIFYLDNSFSSIGKEIFWFDQEIKVIKNYKNIKNSIGIINISRKLILKFEDELSMHTWYQILINKIDDYHLSLKNNYDSFANERSNCNANWFVDAHDYFSHLYDKMLTAKENIFIAGWWVSPELYLKRPVKKGDLHSLRLMDILKHKAEQGVKIKILIYKEFKMAVSVNSQHTKELLNDLHPNIKVTRHPKASLDLLWSTHEKIVIIDQTSAYAGGIDLCWGRYDDHEHKVTEEENKEELYYWPGIDYSNSRLRDFENVNDHLKENIPRNSSCRMPWHDVSVFLTGPVVDDLNRHFVERWNFARTLPNQELQKNHTITHVKGKPSKFENIKPDSKVSSFLRRPISFYNFFTKKSEDKYSSTDIEGMINKNIAQKGRRNMEKVKLPEREARKNKSSILDKMKGVFLRVKKEVKKKISMKPNSFSLREPDDFLNINIKPSSIPYENKMKCQILRSVSNWSAGLIKKDENSIQKAYYDLIDNAKHYILIENQFFISKTYADEENEKSTSKILNEVALHIRNRIEKAFKTAQKFRVFIIIPLLPGFPGEVHETVTLQILLKYTYKTISRNCGLSIIEKLYNLMGDKMLEYISFFSLRTHGIIKGIPFTEIIYVHSKIMIVDDEIALIGSANINDRSLLGSRDSEVAVIIRDEYKVYSKMDGKQYLAANFAQSLRIRLFKEHLGINLEITEFPEILLDPLNDRLFNVMKKIANTNTILYREIFNCYPDDKVQKFSDLAKLYFSNSYHDNLATSLKIEKYFSYKDKIKGNLVEFPLNFLKQEYLNRTYFCKEILVPIKNFL